MRITLNPITRDGVTRTQIESEMLLEILFSHIRNHSDSKEVITFTSDGYNIVSRKLKSGNWSITTYRGESDQSQGEASANCKEEKE